MVFILKIYNIIDVSHMAYRHSLKVREKLSEKMKEYYANLTPQEREAREQLRLNGYKKSNKNKTGLSSGKKLTDPKKLIKDSIALKDVWYG